MAEESDEKEWVRLWGAKVKVPADMPDDLLKFVIQTTGMAIDAVVDPAVPDQTAWEENGLGVTKAIKAALDDKWGPSWHVVIGKNFGSFVTHECKRFLYFYWGEKAVMIFKAA